MPKLQLFLQPKCNQKIFSQPAYITIGSVLFRVLQWPLQYQYEEQQNDMPVENHEIRAVAILRIDKGEQFTRVDV